MNKRLPWQYSWTNNLLWWSSGKRFAMAAFTKTNLSYGQSRTKHLPWQDFWQIFVTVIFKKKCFDVAELLKKKSHTFFYGHIHEQRFSMAALINITSVIATFLNERSVKANFLHESFVMLTIIIEWYTVAEFLNNKLVMAASAKKKKKKCICI
jgi:hypothetical protein